MIKENTIVTMTTPIEGYEELLNKDFTVTKITDNVIIFKNPSLGGGMISVDEFYTYFTEKNSLITPKPISVPDPYEVDPTPYSHTWTNWTYYSNNNLEGFYRYRDCPNGSVKLEFYWEDCDADENSPKSIGRATCHRDDIFNLDNGLQLCAIRADIKYYNAAINDINTRTKHFKKELSSLVNLKEEVEEELILLKGKEALVISELTN